MSNHNKHRKRQATVLVVAAIIINAHIVKPAYADESVEHEWTKRKVREIIGAATDFQWDDGFKKELRALENDADAVSQYLIEILEESDDDDGEIIESTLITMGFSKNKHELFSNAISNKLESVKGGPEWDREWLQRNANWAFERMKQTREIANANIPADSMNPVPNVEPVSVNSTSSEKTSAQDEPARHTNSEAQPKRKSWLWLFAFPVVAGITWCLWRGKK